MIINTAFRFPKKKIKNVKGHVIRMSVRANLHQNKCRINPGMYICSFEKG